MLDQLKHELRESLTLIGGYETTKHIFAGVDDSNVDHAREAMCEQLTKLTQLLTSMASVEVDKKVTNPQPF